jgi:DNA-binding response OmpR family regulator
VLLVESRSETREVLAYGVALLFTAATVDHVDTAVRAWNELGSEIHLVVVDHDLADSDGPTLIAKLRADPALARTPIIAIGVAGPTARKAALMAGADAFLDKPIVFRDLFATLRALFQLARGSKEHLG